MYGDGWGDEMVVVDLVGVASSFWKRCEMVLDLRVELARDTAEEGGAMTATTWSRPRRWRWRRPAGRRRVMVVPVCWVSARGVISRGLGKDDGLKGVVGEGEGDCGRGTIVGVRVSVSVCDGDGGARANKLVSQPAGRATWAILLLHETWLPAIPTSWGRPHVKRMSTRHWWGGNDEDSDSNGDDDVGMSGQIERGHPRCSEVKVICERAVEVMFGWGSCAPSWALHRKSDEHGWVRWTDLSTQSTSAYGTDANGTEGNIVFLHLSSPCNPIWALS
ncbi:hypothetical protein FPV67DRAFT_1458169 [Lyophyllum atratum]|nr:hypothetical protein FPV67DRAFT_1458169 [Lyophyllum atratum]